jgi:D-alanine-D-alanine ligase
MKVAVLYNLVDSITKGTEEEIISDNEVLKTAEEVRDILARNNHEASLIRVDPKGMASFKLQLKDLKQYDLVFNLAEGIGGRLDLEPEIALAMEKEGIRFTGNNHSVMSLCRDKERAKEFLEKNQYPTPKHYVSGKKKHQKLTFPLFVKPLTEDGSVGITDESVVNNEKSLTKQIKHIEQLYKQPALVEEYIDGSEINGAIVGSPGNYTLLPLSEINFTFPEGKPRIVSFAAKWTEGSIEYCNTESYAPARLEKHMEEKLRKMTLDVCGCVGCTGYARVDYRIRGSDIFIIEVNPNPCISKDSGFYRASLANGWSYEDLIMNIFKAGAQL